MIQGKTHHVPTPRIEVNRSPVWIYYANEVWRVFEKRHKYLALILNSFAFADIAHNCRNTHNSVGRIKDRRNRQRYWKNRSIPSTALAFEAFRLPALLNAVHHRLVFPQAIFGNDGQYRLSDRLARLVSEHPLGRMVP